MLLDGPIVPRGLGCVAVGLLVSGCASISGLRDYSSGPGSEDAPSAAAVEVAPGDGASTPDVTSPGAPVCSDGGCDAGDACSDCEVDGPGRPLSCTTAFGYAPSNFVPASYAAPRAATTIDCDAAYDSTTHSFTGWCPGRQPPRIAPDVPQANGPNVDVLAFRALTVAAGGTLKLTGRNAIILAVYGDATIEGTIDADGAEGVSGGGVAGTSGPGGDYACGAAAGGDAVTATSNSGGGGGAASTAGGQGANDCPVVAAGGVGGSARPNGSLGPLYGGCPGGRSGPGGCTTGGGGGGGAVQISAAGALAVAGSLTANGGAGGTSACTEIIVGVTYRGGSGGGGSGGAVLLEGHTVSVTGATSVRGGNGGTGGGSGATSSSSTGTDGTPTSCPGTGVAGGGGGGGYGYARTTTGAASSTTCSIGSCVDGGCN